MPADRRLTIIVVPETGKRPRTFRLSRVWFALVGLLVVVLSTALYLKVQESEVLRGTLAEMDDLKRTNRHQQAELETMRRKAEQTDLRLQELANLEAQIRDLTDPNAPSRSGFMTDPTLENATGRGGPRDSVPAGEGLPTLSAMLPPEVRGHLFARRDTLPLHLAQPQVHTATRQDQTTVTNVQESLDYQLVETERLQASLQEGKKAVEERLDYLAHRPTGYPVSGAILTDRFGMRWSPFGWGRQKHEGLDLAHNYWTPVVSSGKGIVIHSGWKSGGYGYAVLVDHGYGFVTMYAHLADTNVDVGDEVTRGQLIGWVGSTGLSTGPHLHYEVHLWGVPVDPLKYIN